MKHVLPLISLLSLPLTVSAQGFSPADAVKRMKLPPGFSVTCVAHEPMIRQPLSISHDDRGRLWVLQYLQYPNPAGLKPLKQDQYLRTIWDRVPEPPPKGPKGLDRITICYDPDANGIYTKSRDFIRGLNLATGFCLGNGGVYVVQPPYLLYYADKNGDDVPDSETPEVLLTGFGMEDTHSYANSLLWGPDGWLYGAHGSTVTAKIKNPSFPNEPVVEFQQGIWRFHPKTHRFELFSEGGGNTYGLDFDKHGQVIAGTNYNGVTMLHQMQGAYYVKGFSKHGPLHNAHTYGYFDHVPHENFRGGHVTCGGVVYQGDTFPTEMQDQYIAGNLLANDVYWSRMTAKGSSFTSKHGGELIQSNDTWCRPVDLMVGPEGSIYIADWYDKRAAHLDPVDNWDKTNGRVYRVDYVGTKLTQNLDLRKQSSLELCELLKHPNAWYRREARQLLVERGAGSDSAVIAKLKAGLSEPEGTLALESLWTLYSIGIEDPNLLISLLKHPHEYVRAWAVRLIADNPEKTNKNAAAQLAELAKKETSLPVRAQLACTAKRLPAENAIAIVAALIHGPTDAQMPNLLWWAIEGHVKSANILAALSQERSKGSAPIYLGIVEKISRRLMASDIPDGQSEVRKLVDRGSREGILASVLKGIAAALEGSRLEKPNSGLVQSLKELRKESKEELLVTILVRMGDTASIQEIRERFKDEKRPISERTRAIELLRQVHDTEIKPLLLKEWASTKSDPFRVALLSGMEAFDDPEIGTQVLARYGALTTATKKRAVSTLVARKAWASALIQSIEAKQIPATDVASDQVRSALALDDKDLTARFEKQYGKLAQATAGEKIARITWLTREASVNKGDPVNGKALFKQHCANCHMLFGEGNKIGPDLTAADRKNLGYMISQVVDPSAVVRPEYVQHTVQLLDGRKLAGIVLESTDKAMTLVDAQNNKILISKSDIEELKPTGVSLMPEKLLDTLSYQQIADLFSYIRSDPPKPKK